MMIPHEAETSAEVDLERKTHRDDGEIVFAVDIVQQQQPQQQEQSRRHLREQQQLLVQKQSLFSFFRRQTFCVPNDETNGLLLYETTTTNVWLFRAFLYRRRRYTTGACTEDKCSRQLCRHTACKISYTFFPESESCQCLTDEDSMIPISCGANAKCSIELDACICTEGYTGDALVGCLQEEDSTTTSPTPPTPSSTTTSLSLSPTDSPTPSSSNGTFTTSTFSPPSESSPTASPTSSPTSSSTLTTSTASPTDSPTSRSTPAMSTVSPTASPTISPTMSPTISPMSKVELCSSMETCLTSNDDNNNINNNNMTVGKWVNKQCNEKKCVSDVQVASYLKDGYECGNCGFTQCFETEDCVTTNENENEPGKWVNIDCYEKKCVSDPETFIKQNGWACGNCGFTHCMEAEDCTTLDDNYDNDNGNAGKWMNYHCDENRCMSDPETALQNGWECGKCTSYTCDETSYSNCTVVVAAAAYNDNGVSPSFVLGKWVNHDCKENQCVTDVEPYLDGGWGCGKCGIPFCMETRDCTTENGEVGKWMNYQCSENKCVSDPETYLTNGWECEICYESDPVLPACPDYRCTTDDGENSGALMYVESYSAQLGQAFCNTTCVSDNDVDQYFDNWWECGNDACFSSAMPVMCSYANSCIARGGQQGTWISYPTANGQCLYFCSPTADYYIRRGWTCGRNC